ncbi:YEATS domain-containing protein 2 [Mortierella sp. GBA43]|nr:YEATS domain-containing protein 2 [Mortierella sp. GBA43]
MLLPANSDTNGVASEASVDVTMTTPDDTAPPTPAATTMAADVPHQPDGAPRSFESQPTVAEDARTEATRQKVVDVIDHQFDLEILLRHAESVVISKELAKAERMLEDLRHAILSERQGSAFGNSIASRAFGNLAHQQGQHHSSRQSSRRATAFYGRDVRQPEALYAVRADGEFVRCDRYDFGSIQGLINHMRLSHKLVFKNTEEGVRYCGIVVPSSEVPLDHPCRSKIVFSSLGSSDVRQLQSDFPKPTIKTYDEDVDLESDDGRAKSHNRGESSQRIAGTTSVHSSSNAGSDSESDSSGDGSGGEGGLGAGKRRRSSLALSIVRPQKGTRGSNVDKGSDSDGSEDNDDSGNEAHRPRHSGKGPMRKYESTSQGPPAIGSRSGVMTNYNSRISSTVSSRAVSPNIHPLMSENDFSEPPTPVSALPTLPLSNTILNPVAGSTPEVQQAHSLQPTIISFGASSIQGGVPAPLDTVGSRFYVKRRIVVGNVSKFIPEEKRDPRLKDFPYKWMIYVDGTPKPDDITAYVSKVEFYLHESYKPNDFITVSEPPFHLSRYAWGETQIKVRMFFHDSRNKPVEVYHRLAVHGRERHVDLELDRNTTFLAVTPFNARSKSGYNKSASRNNLILNSAAEVAMAATAEEDERELQITLSKPNASSMDPRGTGTGSGGFGAANGSSTAMESAGALASDTLVKRHTAKETTLLYCKACGSLWKQHRDGALGVAGAESESVVLSEDGGQRIPSCPHHPRFYAVKDVAEDEQGLLSLLMGRTRNKFALDMLKNCGIVDEHGRPISNQDPLDPTMELDVGDSELPIPSTNPVGVVLPMDLRHKMDQLTDAFKKKEVFQCRRSEIDWVLSVMDELKLKTLLLDGGAGGGSGGSRNGVRERDQAQEQLLNTPGLVNVPDSMSQRAVVGGLLVQATKAFLGSILSKAVDIHRKETEDEKGPESIMMELDSLHGSNEDGNGEDSGANERRAAKVSEKLLTPYHVYQALQSDPGELDFLTNQHEDMEGIGEMMVGL